LPENNKVSVREIMLDIPASSQNYFPIGNFYCNRRLEIKYFPIGHFLTLDAIALVGTTMAVAIPKPLYKKLATFSVAYSGDRDR
jgi:hypothetical protein